MRRDWRGRVLGAHIAVPELRRFQYKIYARGDCWEWRGARNQEGYGSFRLLWRTILAHRYAYGVSKGSIPAGLQLDHICRHRWCVRPSHLEVVTARTNTLRGSYAGDRARATHCQRGHEFTPENTYIRRGTHLRTCKACVSEGHRRNYQRKKLLVEKERRRYLERGDA